MGASTFSRRLSGQSREAVAALLLPPHSRAWDQGMAIGK
jgi:hypothetical protein